ncbi:hypothetical protein Tco_1440336 [Tanacetum coccineum]
MVVVPMCQGSDPRELLISQTYVENVSKLSNDSLLTRGNILQSDEDRLKLNELMELCTTLQKKVLDLEKTKTTQANEIAKSFKDKESLGEDASKQGRINVIEADEDITLVNIQDDIDKEMYDVGTVTGDEVFAEQEVAAKDVNLTIDEVTLAQALAALKSVKPKVKGDVIEEQNVPVNAANASTKVSTTATTVTITTEEITLAQALEALKTSKPKDKGKGIMIEEPVKPMKKKVQIMLDEEVALKKYTSSKFKVERGYDLSIQETFDRALKRVNTFEDFRTELVEGKEKRAGEKLVQESIKKQKVEDEKETAELKKLMEIIPDEEEVAIDAIPLAIKSPRIVD